MHVCVRIQTAISIAASAGNDDSDDGNADGVMTASSVSMLGGPAAVATTAIQRI